MPDTDLPRFVTGGKPGPGRPKGSRNKLAESFTQALHDDFMEHGVAAIATVRAEKPDQYLKVIASLVPKDVNLNVGNMEELSDDELAERVRNLASQLAPFLSGGIGDAYEGVGGEEGAEIPSKLH